MLKRLCADLILAKRRGTNKCSHASLRNAATAIDPFTDLSSENCRFQ
jgi:hypothetical protein